MKSKLSTSYFVPMSWSLVGAEAVVAFVWHYSSAVPGFWASLAVAVFITVFEARRTR